MPVRTVETYGPYPVDTHVGNRIRGGRLLRGLSQGRLGTALGITFQQIQKYEGGVNRISASRLYQLAKTLEVPVGYFFQGYAEEGEEAPEQDLADTLQQERENGLAIKLLGAYRKLRRDGHPGAEALVRMAEAMAGEFSETSAPTTEE